MFCKLCLVFTWNYWQTRIQTCDWRRQWGEGRAWAILWIGCDLGGPHPRKRRVWEVLLKMHFQYSIWWGLIKNLLELCILRIFITNYHQFIIDCLYGLVKSKLIAELWAFIIGFGGGSRPLWYLYLIIRPCV